MLDQHRKDNYIQIRITSREKSKIKEIAEASRTTVSDMIIEFIQQKIEQAEQQAFEDATREAIAAGGGCIRCGDLTGFECICEE